MTQHHLFFPVILIYRKLEKFYLILRIQSQNFEEFTSNVWINSIFVFTHFSTSYSLNGVVISKKTVTCWFELNTKINKTCNHFYVNDNLFHQTKGSAIDKHATCLCKSLRKFRSWILSFMKYILNIWYNFRWWYQT